MPRFKKKDKVKDVKDLVLIIWVDAEAACDWKDMSDVAEWKDKQFTCKEVGWIIDEDENNIILTSQLGDENLIGNRSKIPKSWILGKKALKWTKPTLKKRRKR
jgi:hypothetical protein